MDNFRGTTQTEAEGAKVCLRPAVVGRVVARMERTVDETADRKHEVGNGRQILSAPLPSVRCDRRMRRASLS